MHITLTFFVFPSCKTENKAQKGKRAKLKKKKISISTLFESRGDPTCVFGPSRDCFSSRLQKLSMVRGLHKRAAGKSDRRAPLFLFRLMNP